MKSDLDALMQARNLDAILVLGNAEHNPPMYYFTGGGHVSGAVLFKKPGAEPVIYCNAMERAEAAKSGLRVIPLRTGAVGELASRPKEIFAEQDCMARWMWVSLLICIIRSAMPCRILNLWGSRRTIRFFCAPWKQKTRPRSSGFAKWEKPQPKSLAWSLLI